MTYEERKFCQGCQRMRYFSGHHCDSCMRLLEQAGESARLADEWRQRFPTAEALQAWRAEQEQRQREYRKQQERLRLMRRERRRRRWRWVLVALVVYAALLLIVNALR